MTNRPWNWRGHVTWSSLNFKAANNISGRIEARILKFLTHVGYDVKRYQKDAYHPLNGHGYGHVTVFKNLPFTVMQRVARVRQWQLMVVYAAGKFCENQLKMRFHC